MRVIDCKVPSRVPAHPLHAMIALGLMLTGCASTPPEDDPVQIKLNELDARVGRIERVISNQSLVELAQNLQQVQSDVRQLRGRVDELENSNEAMRKQQRDLYADLEKRLGGNAAGSSGSGAGAPGTAAGAGAGGAGAGGAAALAPGAGSQPQGSSVEQSVYTQAFDALKAGSYSVAITGFKDFLTNYPASPLAENAQYWLGEAYYVTRAYDEASTAFRTVLQKWPNSRKAPDALLKLGFTQFELKRYAESRKTLQDVVQKYPDSDAARLASERLKRIPANAH
ncbi:MAG TPA: tol-pal system protein YbgF [Steroidobacteraceae bacterium]